MGRFIVRIKDKFFVWSTVVDAPITGGMSLEGLTAWVRNEDGVEGLKALPQRLERVMVKGTSSMLHDNVREHIRSNRAGPKGARLTIKQIYNSFSDD